MTASTMPSVMNWLQHAAAARPQRRANRKFPLTRFGTREQQVREVRARDEQHERDGALQHPDGLLHLAHHVVLQRIDPVVDASSDWGHGDWRSELGQRPSSVSRSARACSIVTPGLRRPTRYRKWPPRLPGFAGSMRQRPPQLDLLVVHVVAGRHDADDAVRSPATSMRRPTVAGFAPNALRQSS